MRARVSLRLLLPVLLAGLLAALALPARASALALQSIGSYASPVYVTAPPGDPRVFVVELGGTIKVKNGAVPATTFLDISSSVATGGERGLLSMAFDPNYAVNGIFYVLYTGDGDDPIPGGDLGDIFIDEFKVGPDPDVADPVSRRTVLTFPHSADNHNGGQLQFGPDGLLYISVGDNANSSNAQALGNLYGKLLRIDPHQSGPDQYTIPASNPFVVSLSARHEIWSLGLRNPWRFSFDRVTGALTIGDVGGGQREEVNWRPQSVGGGRGDNFGWPACEGFIGTDCTTTFTPPIHEYPHTGCSYYAITGGYVYRGSDIPQLRGRYLYSDICFQELRSLIPSSPLASGDRAEGLAIGGSPWSFGEDSRCEIYVAAGDNQVSKIVPFAGAEPVGGGCTAAPPPSSPAPLNPTATTATAAISQPSTKRRRSCKTIKKAKKRRKCRRKKRKKRR